MSWSRDFVHDGEARRVSCRSVDGDRYEVLVGDTQHEVRARRLPDGRVSFELDGVSYVAAAARLGDGGVQVRVADHTWSLPAFKSARGGASAQATGDVTAPMTGTVLSIGVEVGQEVEAGATVAIVTAMKMEHKLTAGIDGKIVEITAAEGDNVDEGTLLVRIE